MPDIEMCIDKDCPIKEKCWRFTATPHEFRQAYGNHLRKGKKCEDFKSNKGRQKHETTIDNETHQRLLDESIEKYAEIWKQMNNE